MYVAGGQNNVDLFIAIALTGTRIWCQNYYRYSSGKIPVFGYFLQIIKNSLGFTQKSHNHRGCGIF